MPNTQFETEATVSYFADSILESVLRKGDAGTVGAAVEMLDKQFPHLRGVEMGDSEAGAKRTCECLECPTCSKRANQARWRRNKKRMAL